MSDESFEFTPGPTPKFPKLIMRAFTPPNDAGWFEYKFEAKQENGVLFINFDRTIMTPKNPDAGQS